MDIRPCTAADLSVLCSRWRTPGGVHEAHHARQLAGQTTYLVAWRDQEPLGSGVLTWGGCIGSNARSAYPQAVELNHLQVRDQYRGQGVGSALIAGAEALASRAGRDQMAVGVAEDNPDAERLYRRLGYRPTGVIDVSEYDWIAAEGAVRHETERDQLLIKDLSPLAPAQAPPVNVDLEDWIATSATRPGGKACRKQSPSSVPVRSPMSPNTPTPLPPPRTPG